MIEGKQRRAKQVPPKQLGHKQQLENEVANNKRGLEQVSTSLAGVSWSDLLVPALRITDVLHVP